MFLGDALAMFVDRKITAPAFGQKMLQLVLQDAKTLEELDISKIHNTAACIITCRTAKMPARAGMGMLSPQEIMEDPRILSCRLQTNFDKVLEQLPKMLYYSSSSRRFYRESDVRHRLAYLPEFAPDLERLSTAQKLGDSITVFVFKPTLEALLCYAEKARDIDRIMSEVALAPGIKPKVAKLRLMGL